MAPLEFPAKKCFSRGKIPPWKTAAPFLLLCLIRIVQKGFLLSISVTISNSDGICQDRSPCFSELRPEKRETIPPYDFVETEQELLSRQFQQREKQVPLISV